MFIRSNTFWKFVFTLCVMYFKSVWGKLKFQTCKMYHHWSGQMTITILNSYLGTSYYQKYGSSGCLNNKFFIRNLYFASQNSCGCICVSLLRSLLKCHCFTSPLYRLFPTTVIMGMIINGTLWCEFIGIAVWRLRNCVK